MATASLTDPLKFTIKYLMAAQEPYLMRQTTTEAFHARGPVAT
jgi:hypothetical protein